jgi:peptidoglycan/xylan/chitin deacetylase (PgdA/CDA1 family)
MEFLKVHYYNVLSLTEVADRVKNGKGFAPKSLAITFDDGYQDNIKNAFPILKKMGFPATVFVITDNIGKEGWLSEEDLRILDGSGITIGSHTVHHAFLPALSSAEAEAELKDSKKRLEEVLGHPVTLFSYPAGGLTPRVEDLVKETCYAGAVTTNNGKEPGDAYAMHRIKITEAHGSLFDFWAKVSGLYQFGKKRVTATDGGEAMAE